MSDTIQLKSEYEGAEVFSSEPLVAVRNNVISPIECAYLIELALSLIHISEPTRR